MDHKLEKEVVHKIMNRAIGINKSNPMCCRDFEIMASTLRLNVLILRYTTIDISNIDNPIQCFGFECFELDGTAKMCSVYYSNQEEANAFLMSLESLYHQEYAMDHTL